MLMKHCKKFTVDEIAELVKITKQEITTLAKSSNEMSVMLNKSVLNYYSHFSSLFPDFFLAIVFYSSRRIVSDKKKSRDIKK